MRRFARPFDEEGNGFDAASPKLRQHSEARPSQRFPRERLAGAVAWTEDTEARLASRRGDRFNISCGRSPIHEPRFVKLSDVDVEVVRGLRRIRRDDLEIMPRTER